MRALAERPRTIDTRDSDRPAAASLHRPDVALRRRQPTGLPVRFEPN